MYGLINKAIEELVVTNFGEAPWEIIKNKAGVEVDVFVSNEAYPDDMTYDLVDAASVVLGTSASAILITFGEHWVLKTAATRKGRMRAGGAFFVLPLISDGWDSTKNDRAQGRRA